MDNTITLKELINLKESNKFLYMKDVLLGRTVTELQNSYNDYMQAIIVDINDNEITLMTTSSIGEGNWNDRTRIIDRFNNGFSSNIKSKIKDCFIPSKDQLDGGWCYMTSASRRALVFWYWTDTPSHYFTYAWRVRNDGHFRSHNVYCIIDYVAGFTI